MSYGMIWRDTEWHEMAWDGMVWYSKRKKEEIN